LVIRREGGTKSPALSPASVVLRPVSRMGARLSMQREALIPLAKEGETLKPL
jgi:hypothetical protein